MPAIKLRYGAYSDFVPSKLLPAEVGVVQTGDPNTTDGVAIYICAKNGTVKRFTTADDLTDALTDLLDDTLSVQDKAAEAAAVGTAIQALTAQVTSIESEITGIESDLTEVTEVDAGTVDKSTGVKLSAYINSAATKMASDVNCMLVYFPCLPSVTYTINKVLSARFRVGYTTVTPADNVQIFGGVADNTATSISLETSSNAQYLVVYYYDSANDTLSESEIYNSLTITYRGEMSAVDKVARADKVDKQQDVSDAGKAMIVGNDGVLAPTEIADGLSETAKIALLNCFANVVWKTGSANDYYNALEMALYADAYPKIVAVYTPGAHVVYTDDDLDTLKPYLTVYYYASESSEAVVVPSTDYTISGNLTAGTSSMIVRYGNTTGTFIVTDVIDGIWHAVYPDDTDLEVAVGKQGDIVSSWYVETSNAGRATLYRKTGTEPICDGNKVPLDRYLIKIPADATSITIEMQPATLYAYLSGCTWHTDHYYRRWTSDGWVQTGANMSLSSFVRSDQRYLGINFKANSAGTGEVSVSSVKITFNAE